LLSSRIVNLEAAAGADTSSSVLGLASDRRTRSRRIMLLHAVAMSLLYVDSRGVDKRVDLAECLATNKPRSNHPPVCYLTLPGYGR